MSAENMSQVNLVLHLNLLIYTGKVEASLIVIKRNNYFLSVKYKVNLAVKEKCAQNYLGAFAEYYGNYVASPNTQNETLSFCQVCGRRYNHRTDFHST